MELFFSDWSSPGDKKMKEIYWYSNWDGAPELDKWDWYGRVRKTMRHTTGRIELRKRPKKCYYGCPWRIQQRTERENYHLPRENCYKKIESVSALQKTILPHAIRIITCVVEWTTSLFISFLLCKINVCRFVCIYLILDNFIFIVLLSDSN